MFILSVSYTVSSNRVEEACGDAIVTVVVIVYVSAQYSVTTTTDVMYLRVIHKHCVLFWADIYVIQLYFISEGIEQRSLVNIVFHFYYFYVRY